MSNTTEYAGLTTWEPYGADANVEGRAFVAGLAGDEATSNMQIIDALLKGKASYTIKTSTQWAADNITVLRTNDFGIASDTSIIKRGDGTNVWSALSEFDPTYKNFVAAGYSGSQSEFYTLIESISTHTHGNISNDGKIGTEADKILVTGANGAIVAKTGTEAKTLLNIQDGANGVDGTNGVNGTDGVGVQSVEQTTSSSEDGGTNVVTVTLTNGDTATFNILNGNRGTNGYTGSDGTTFTPAVSAEGVISWTNDSEVENPASVNIKGPAGPNEISIATATAINGLMKGNGSNVAQAVPGTDYATPATDLTATLTVAGWSAQAPYTQTVNVTGITAAMKPIVDIVLSGTQATAETELTDWGKVSKIETGAGTITATCFTAVPTVALNLTIKVVG